MPAFAPCESGPFFLAFPPFICYDNRMKRTSLFLLCICLCFAQLSAAQGEAVGPAAPATASGLIAFVRSKLGMGYIYSAYGHVSDASFCFGRSEQYPDQAKYIKAYGRQWDGVPAYDCIGLFKAYILSIGAPVSFDGINTGRAWLDWAVEKGSIQDAILQPGMALFRVEGPRNTVKHIGVYVGNGKVIHARGTRWGVVEDMLPDEFTHWARFYWIDYDLPPDTAPAVTDIFLPMGSLAVVQDPLGVRTSVSETPYEASTLRYSIGYFADGTILTVVGVPDEISRLVTGIDIHGNVLSGYVRTTDLREARPSPLQILLMYRDMEGEP